jgi:dihydroorotate dehydrogenase electron transfer subunit
MSSEIPFQAWPSTILVPGMPDGVIACMPLLDGWGVPCQVSLEEFMACAVGGCAGCAVPVVTESGLAMKRVCVDGPVFEASAVFPPAA